MAGRYEYRYNVKRRGGQGTNWGGGRGRGEQKAGAPDSKRLAQKKTLLHCGTWLARFAFARTPLLPGVAVEPQTGRELKRFQRFPIIDSLRKFILVK